MDRGTTFEEAETIALQFLAFILSDPERRKAFLDKTGLDEFVLRKRLKDTDHLAGILDYLSADEDLLGDFCTQIDISPTSAMQAWKKLSNPDSNLQRNLC
ncbi:MAG: hypothetical protein CMM32_03245 [Rhodospirillaceae bacterium]|nr:hypothetical protein [Rhodospirillaceae bacterium]|tara:strand:+ start:65 stop:364 length:300 start_codon:yes stop_codon:yes gene_type:complete